MCVSVCVLRHPMLVSGIRTFCSTPILTHCALALVALSITCKIINKKLTLDRGGVVNELINK